MSINEENLEEEFEEFEEFDWFVWFFVPPSLLLLSMAINKSLIIFVSIMLRHFSGEIVWLICFFIYCVCFFPCLYILRVRKRK